MRDATRPAGGDRTARYVVFAVTVAVLGLFATFVVGEALVDPGGTEALLLSAAWVVPAAALSIFAVLRPRAAAPVLLVLVLAVAVLEVGDAFVDVVPEEDIGPVGLVVGLAVAIPLAFLGLRRAVQAGWLLVVLGSSLALSVLVESMSVGGPRPTAVVVAVPFVLFGGMFVLSDAARRSPTGAAPPRVRPSH
jgi:hypothetical protein